MILSAIVIPVLLILVKLIPTAADRSRILTSPTNTTRKIGGTAQFKCELEFGEIKVMNWEFNDKIIYSLQNHNEDYPKGGMKYSVTREGKFFTLEIMDLQCSDGGQYRCRLPSMSREAHLVVFDSPKAVIPTSTPVEGETALFTCEARFGGPINEVGSFNAFFNGSLKNGTQSNPEVLGDDCFQITKSMNVTIEHKMNGIKFHCELQASNHTVYASTSTQIHVAYTVRNIDFIPRQDQYAVGSVIVCTADGNPRPTFKWQDIMNSGRHFMKPWLQISDDMEGHNVWKCTATNTVKGITYNGSIMAYFNADTLIGQAVEKNDSWKITLGVMISLCFLLVYVVAIGVCVIKDMLNTIRKLYEKMGTSETTTYHFDIRNTIVKNITNCFQRNRSQHNDTYPDTHENSGVSGEEPYEGLSEDSFDSEDSNAGLPQDLHAQDCNVATKVPADIELTEMSRMLPETTDAKNRPDLLRYKRQESSLPCPAYGLGTLERGNTDSAVMQELGQRLSERSRSRDESDFSDKSTTE